MRYFGIFKMKETFFEAIWLFKVKNSDQFSINYDILKERVNSFKKIGAIEATDDFLDFLNENYEYLQNDLRKNSKEELVLVDELDYGKYSLINEMIKEEMEDVYDL